jgi:hypothetical protein
VASDPECLTTQVNKITRMIFLEKDQHLLSYRSAEGRLVEPTCFPIVPTILINGTSSVGVGFQTYVPPRIETFAQFKAQKHRVTTATCSGIG